MATYTTNYNLGKPEASDPFGNFRQLFNDNMDEIDANLGGGGGGGGHTIVDENGSDMPAESKLQFTGNVSVTDDNVNGATVVDVLGGGGNVYGAFVDTNRILLSTTAFTGSYSYTATEDCFVCFYISPRANDDTFIQIDGENVGSWWRSSVITDTASFYVRKGQTISVPNAHTSYNSYIWVYGITQGTNGIYAPVIYSDNERVIGVWRDNKPLYQKSFVKNSTDISGAGVSFDVSALDIDTCVDVFGTCDRIVAGVGTLIYPFNAYEDASLRTYLAYSKFNTCINFNIRFYVGESTSTQYITILYTKNSDVAGSGNWNTDGVPTHHYSTSEQVIGTWYNGKPIYQKVLTPTVGAGYNSLAHGISDLDECIKIWGTCKYNNRAEWLSLPYVSTALNYEITLGNVTASNYILEAGAGFTSFEDVRIVIEYTKTTD